MEKIKKILLIILTSLLFVISLVSVSLNIYQQKEIKSIERQDENIVFFGDSITEGYNVKEFYDDLNVVNSGISGNQTIDLLTQIDTRLYDYNPSKVIILIGINDINRGKSDNEILNNIKDIIKGIKKTRKNADIYIQSIYPINRNKNELAGMLYNEDVNNKRVKELNKKIKKLCKINDIPYINVYDALSDSEGNLKDIYTKDGVHLTDLGYYKVTKTIKKYIWKLDFIHSKSSFFITFYLRDHLNDFL